MPNDQGAVQVIRAPTKTLTFDGSSGFGLINTASTIWTITGRVAITYVSIYVDVGLAGGVNASLKVGVTGNTAEIRSTLTVSNLTVGKMWSYSGRYTTDAENIVTQTTAGSFGLISANVIASTTVADITSGALVFDCYYLPLTSDGSLV